MAFTFITLIFPPGRHRLIYGLFALKIVNTRVTSQSEELLQIKLTKKKPKWFEIYPNEFNRIQ